MACSVVGSVGTVMSKSGGFHFRPGYPPTFSFPAFHRHPSEAKPHRVPLENQQYLSRSRTFSFSLATRSSTNFRNSLYNSARSATSKIPCSSFNFKKLVTTKLGPLLYRISHRSPSIAKHGCHHYWRWAFRNFNGALSQAQA